MSDLTLFEGGASVPDHIRKDADNPVNTVDELSAGVSAGFPVLSFRGKVWRVKKSGEERPYVDDNGDPKPSMELVLVRGSANISKIYYPKGYEEGSNEAPGCFSMDGHRPDPNSSQQQADLCAACPHNQWGSKITPDGKKTKACADNRRIAVVSLADLKANGPDATPLLLRIPGGSLTTLKEYAERTLAPRGFPYYSVVTRLGFDQQASYPKLVFRPMAPLDKDFYDVVKELRTSDEVSRILSDHSDIVEPPAARAEGRTQPDNAAAQSGGPANSDGNGQAAAAKPVPEPIPEKVAAQSPPPNKASNKLDKVKSDVDALLGTL